MRGADVGHRTLKVKNSPGSPPEVVDSNDLCGVAVSPRGGATADCRLPAEPETSCTPSSMTIDPTVMTAAVTPDDAKHQPDEHAEDRDDDRPMRREKAA